MMRRVDLLFNVIDMALHRSADSSFKPLINKKGLIIDAFGELRDQLESVKEDMESNCFICGMGKDYFDKVPHGFDTHVQQEHNLANYMFFLMHLINKPDTEYTGQETYVWNMYQQRCWDFFPVGDCFRKQYEDELGGGGG